MQNSLFEYIKSCDKKIKEKIKKLLENDTTEEYCPNCDTFVELPPYMGIYKCPSCGELIVCCSMCEAQSCSDCKYTLATEGFRQYERLKKYQNALRDIIRCAKGQCHIMCGKKFENCNETTICILFYIIRKIKGVQIDEQI